MSRRVIVVLGMDRSGTSLCANVLNALGMSVGGELLPADQFNQRGYFEDREIWRVHERILAVLGRSWDTLATVRPFPPRWWELKGMAGFREQLGEIASARTKGAGSGTWGFKDPRTVLLLPLWEGVFRDLALEPTFIVSVRHPGAVAHSLATRDGFPAVISELLWLEKTLTACLASWDKPSCMIHYEDWFVQPLKCIQTLTAVTGLTPSLTRQELKTMVATIVSSEMRHDTGASVDLRSSAAADLYEVLMGCARVPDATVLRDFQKVLASTGEFISGVEEISGSKLPAGVCAPSYMHCTPEDMELIQDSRASEFAPLHDPNLVRAQRLVGEQDDRLREYAKALAHAEALVHQRDEELRTYADRRRSSEELVEKIEQHSEVLTAERTQVQNRAPESKEGTEELVSARRLIAERDDHLRRYAEGLAHAESLVLQRDAELNRYVEALAKAHSIVAEQNTQLRQYDAALGQAQRVVEELNTQLRLANAHEPS